MIVRETKFRLAGDAHQTPIQDLYRALVADESRNQFIVNDVLNALEQGRLPILLTERRDHLECFVSIEKVETHIPFVGALLKKEQDIDALTQYDAKGGRYPKSWQELGPRYNQ